ncbi:MAG: hypothetical protein ACTS73_05565 [Arsenophonus sp. NEOnobi-MAG3]
MRICHEKSTIQLLEKPDITCDPLHELIRNPGWQLIASAAEIELEASHAATRS